MLLSHKIFLPNFTPSACSNISLMLNWYVQNGQDFLLYMGLAGAGFRSPEDKSVTKVFISKLNKYVAKTDTEL